MKWLLANRVKHNVTDVNGRTPVEIAEVSKSSSTSSFYMKIKCVFVNNINFFLIIYFVISSRNIAMKK